MVQEVQSRYEDQDAEELPKMVQRPEIAELCNVIACKQ